MKHSWSRMQGCVYNVALIRQNCLAQSTISVVWSKKITAENTAYSPGDGKLFKCYALYTEKFRKMMYVIARKVF